MTERLDLPDAIVREAVPDDDIVLAYVTRGAMARYVEGVAARSSAFREELLACIDGLEEAGENVSAAARAWRSPATAVVPLRAAPKKRGWTTWTAIALAAALLVVAGGYHRSQMQEAARAQAQKERELEEAKAQLAKLQADLKAQQEAIEVAQNELASAKSDADRANAQARLAAAQQKQAATMAATRPANAAGSKPKSSAKAACNCQPGDALCSCL